ncbi:hypothetical protein RUM43_003491 [Polyplax serrata]|uniref:PXA domain-containing protein n=1 Tax=Polyplax serrata TaxID=468196 RepID=A0AAN8Q0S2_POLSC
MVKEQMKWPKKSNSGFLYEKVVFCSLLFLVIVLLLDSFFHNLPISGYGLFLIIFILIGITTCTTCHAIKWIITSSTLLHHYICEKSQNEKWVKLWVKYESELFQKLLTSSDCFESLKYPTNLNEQVRLLLKDIERDFIKSWYCEVSQNPLFLFDSHLILEEFFFKIIKKLKTVNYRNLVSSILILYLNSLQEYKKSMKKLVRINTDEKDKPKAELSDIYRYFHPGSQNDQILNFYLMKVTKAVLKEFSQYDFSNSLECKILCGIIGRKVVRKFLITLEDPDWINIKLIYLLNSQKHEKLLLGRVYTVKEKVMVTEGTDFQLNKSTPLEKKYLGPSLFENRKNLFYNSSLDSNGSTASQRIDSVLTKAVSKECLTLPVTTEKVEERNSNISSVLTGLIPSTAGPLLPDNITVHYKALNKMWLSPVIEMKDFSESITNSFKKVFINGVKEKKGVARSKSTESLSEESALKMRDISIGEELCENVKFGSVGSTEDAPLVTAPKTVKKLTKTHSFDNSMSMDDEVQEAAVQSPDVKPSTPEHQRDVSPVYEEPEDFATTIAKLRSLLQQRDSTSTLSDKSNPSIDSQTNDKSNSSNKSQSLKGDSFDSQMACDVPTDGRLFVNIFVQRGDSSTGVYSVQYDGIYMLKTGENSSAEPELVLFTSTVNRSISEFLMLEKSLMESNFKGIMKGIIGPSKLLREFNEGKIKNGTFSWRSWLETYLRQVCSKVELCNLPELQEFLAYGQTGNDALVKLDSQPSLHRIEKLLTNKLTGVFNSIKTVLPSFDFDTPNQITTSDNVRGSQDQKLLQGFLNFGQKPESFELNLNFIAKEQTGESLIDDIRRYLSRKSDEDAVDVLDSNDWLTDQEECRFISCEETCVWENHRDIVLDDELEPLDSSLPIYSLIVDIVSELLQDSDCWVVKEPVVRLIKVVSGHWEKSLEDELSKFDWDRIVGNLIRLMRVAIFQSAQGENFEFETDQTKTVLKEAILELMPDWIVEFIKPEGLSSAVSLFVDSFQHFRLNRDVLLRLLDILLVHILSCQHLMTNSTS